MANNRTHKKPKVKFRFYVFCMLFVFIIAFGIKSAVGTIIGKNRPDQPATEKPAITEPSSIVMNNLTEKEATDETEKVGYTEILINFKDTEGNPLDMNIIPNCFITNVIEEFQWKKAIYQNLLDIQTSSGQNLNDTPSLTSFTGNKMTITMNTKTEQYFRFVFIPLDKNTGYNPDLHKELNIYFTTTPADDGIRVEYDAILDYGAAMIDDVLNIKLIKEVNIK